MRITFLSSNRSQPKIGDRRVTKKHGLQIRVVETHGAMWVRSGGRYRYDWRKPAQLLATAWEYLLTSEDRAAIATATDKRIKSMNQGKTNFQRVAEMNIAFGNKKGDPKNIDMMRLFRQAKNIADELSELFEAIEDDDLDGIRDALCDIHIFAYGAHHLMGLDADKDMDEVLTKLMTRFIKDEADKEETIAMHAPKGVTKVYFEGDYPTMVMKSAEDQPDAPKGKFLKSASCQKPVFYQPK